MALAAAGVLAVPLVLIDAPTSARAAEEAPSVIPEDKDCGDCHQETIGKRYVHRAITGQCDICHEQPGDESEHTFEAAVDEDEMCTQCHDLDLAGTAHDPVAKKQCTMCHEIHSSNKRNLMKGSDREVCGSCHAESAAADKSQVHGPFAAGTCTACHSPHASEHGALRREPGSALCLGCHEEWADMGEDTTGWHKPVLDDCGGCHSAHQSDAKFFLKKSQPELCLECHTSVADTLAEATVKHGAITQDSSCAGCHEPHRSQFARLLRTPPADLCLSCHDREYPREGKRPVANMKVELENASQQHGPVREKACEGCHVPHGGQNFRLLKKPYPAKFYAPFDEENYALCFECHEKDRVTAEQSTTTQFRDGTRNLHFVHVNKAKKGRTCRSCHAVHASNLPHHVTETAPFGKYDLPVGFEERENGGACEPGCHVRKEYTR